MTERCDIGDLRYITIAFVDEAGVAADPTTVTFRLRTPDGTETSYVYGTDPEVERTAVGAYRFALTPSVSGPHHYRWVGAGAVAEAEEGFIRVRGSAFTTP